MKKTFTGWADGEADREWACLTFLAAQAPGLAPRPIERLTEGGAPAIVMTRVPGEPLGRSPLTTAQNAALGRALRRLFDVPVGAALRAGLPGRRCGSGELIALLRRRLRDPIDVSECTDPEVVRTALHTARGLLERLPEEQSPHPTIVGIADLNPANVLWDGDRCRLVDFEDGGLSTPACDLADHFEHIAVRPRNMYDTQLLVRSVGLTPDERSALAGHRVLWAVFWLLALLPGSRAHARNPEGTLEGQAERVLDLIEAGCDRPSVE